MYPKKCAIHFLSIVINPNNISTRYKLLVSFRIKEKWLDKV